MPDARSTMAKPTAIEPTHQFVTGDLGLAAWLVTVGQSIEEIRSDGRRALFCFPPGTEPIARRFWGDHQDVLLVRRYHENLRQLRGRAREAVR